MKRQATSRCYHKNLFQDLLLEEAKETVSTLCKHKEIQNEEKEIQSEVKRNRE